MFLLLYMYAPLTKSASLSGSPIICRGEISKAEGVDGYKSAESIGFICKMKALYAPTAIKR